MTNHVTEWLGAYHDGELRGAHLHQVEQHLAECTLCQAELDDLQNLSALLQDSTPNVDFLPTERFVANLALSLPRQSEKPQPREALKISWWLIPVVLLGTWLFIDITFSLSSVVILATDNGLIGGNWAWLQGNPLQMRWFATAMSLFGNRLGTPWQEVLSALNEANVFIAKLAGKLIPQAIVAVFYLGWLVVWWLRHQPQTSESMGRVPQSD